MHSPARSGFALCLILGLASPLAAQTPPAPETPAAPAPEKSSSMDAEAKLAMALRSYALLDAQVDKLKEDNARLVAEKAALEVRVAGEKGLLESKLAEAQSAMPLAAQTVALRDQLRQTQAQMAAYAEENAQLRSKLALGASASHSPSGMMAPTAPAPPPAPAPAPAPAAPPAPRTHVIVMGDTLTKISQTYYGTPSRWGEILAANRNVLKDEKSLIVGKKLVIP